MFQDRVLSGMRPTGAMHLGHYHGALKNWVRLQNEFPCLFFAADWHALTSHYEDPSVIETDGVGHVRGLARRGHRPGEGHALRAVARAAARGADAPHVVLHAAVVARARADLQGRGRAARRARPRPHHLRLPRLPAHAGGRHPHLPGHARAGGRGPGLARGAHARDRPALQPPLRPREGLRGEGGGRDQEDGPQEGEALPGAAQPLPGKGRRGSAGLRRGTWWATSRTCRWATRSGSSASSRAAGA